MDFKFEKLDVWKKALILSNEVNSITNEFPKNEIFIFTSQVKRAADSVSLNIAEGSTGQSDLEFIRFLKYALRSNIEVVACPHLAFHRKYITQEIFAKTYKIFEEILAMIYGLIKSLKTKT